ncbi:MAG: hypothetical protein J6C12_05245 [Lachnospiraceae bacterium]|nr:hypothetical protein [Lachnospiraceae bacterium]
MKEQYQKEVSQIHVPKELLEKTKQAMKEEEQTLSRKKMTGKVIPFKKISMVVAAAILLLVMIPTGISFFRGMDQSENGRQMQMQLQLENHAEPEIVKIGQGGEKALSVKEVDRMPEEFEGADETVIGDIIVRVTADEKTGYLKAYFERDGKAYAVTSKLTDLGEFEEALKKELQ